MTSKDGVTLYTKNKFVADDIHVIPDESLLPNGTITITENGQYDVSNYASANVNVESSGGSGNTLKTLLDNTKNAQYLFYNYDKDNISDLIQYNDTKNVEQWESTFENFKGTKIPPLNTNRMRNMNKKYKNCQKLIDLPQEVSPNSFTYNSTFDSCYLLTKIDLTKFRPDMSSYCSSTFKNCYSLKALIIRDVNTILNSNSLSNCYHILGTQNSTYNPDGLTDGYVYVPRNMIETLSSATNWSTVATQFRALEDYTKDGTTTGEFDDAKAGLV